MHPKRICMAAYGFVDTASLGYGASMEKDPMGKFSIAVGNGCARVHMGLWGWDMEEASSNYREFRNLVERLEAEEEDGELDDMEAFIFTDNFITESTFYNGTLSSRVLSKLVLRLRMLEMWGSLRLHVIHVAGTRMMEQDTDGLSRGSILEGIMSSGSMLDFVPLAQTATEQSPALMG